MQDLRDWQPCALPNAMRLEGRFVTATPLDEGADTAGLFAVLGGAENEDLWTYIPLGPFDEAKALTDFFVFARDHMTWRPYVFRSLEGEVLGMASYMRLRPEHGSGEVGSVLFSKKLQRTPAATEAMYLMARHLFEDLGYRRYEWKCNAENEASRRAAARFGFIYEGTFRKDQVVKGRNRDTDWFSMTDDEWPAIAKAFTDWLDPSNFDQAGGQRRALASFREEG